MFISNNRASFHLWWQKSLVNLQKVSQYYAIDFSFHFSWRFLKIVLLDDSLSNVDFLFYFDCLTLYSCCELYSLAKLLKKTKSITHSSSCTPIFLRSIKCWHIRKWIYFLYIFITFNHLSFTYNIHEQRPIWSLMSHDIMNF